jgi:hypothetical protein
VRRFALIRGQTVQGVGNVDRQNWVVVPVIRVLGGEVPRCIRCAAF